MNRSACPCGQIEDMKHIYICEIYEKEAEKIPFEKIYEDDIRKIKRFQDNLEKREQKLKTENCSPRILKVDPLYNDCTVMEYD